MRRHKTKWNMLPSEIEITNFSMTQMWNVCRIGQPNSTDLVREGNSYRKWPSMTWGCLLMYRKETCISVSIYALGDDHIGQNLPRDVAAIRIWHDCEKLHIFSMDDHISPGVCNLTLPATPIMIQFYKSRHNPSRVMFMVQVPCSYGNSIFKQEIRWKCKENQAN